MGTGQCQCQCQWGFECGLMFKSSSASSAVVLMFGVGNLTQRSGFAAWTLPEGGDVGIVGSSAQRATKT
jgi:hypothetical protein